MHLEDQCVSVELAKQLEKLGVKENSYFEWLFYPKEMEWKVSPKFKTQLGYSAFTSSELFALLPNFIVNPKLAPFDNYRLSLKKFISCDENMNPINNFVINYECDTTEMTGLNAWLTRKLYNNIYDPNLSNALAKTLIYLLENKFMETK